jgi:hypothetical protein
MSQSQNDKLYDLELEAICIQVIQYLQTCIKECKTPEQILFALEHMNQFLESLPRKKH